MSKTSAIVVGVLVIGILVVAIALVYAGATADSTTKTAEARASVVVLLENNVILLLDGRGRVLGRRRLGERPGNPLGAKYLAVDRSGDLRVIVSADARDQLVHATPRGRVVGRVDLPAGVRYRAIAVGKESGRMFLAGESTTNRPTEFDGNAKASVLTVISPAGAVVATVTLRQPEAGDSATGPHDWQIYDLAVAQDERHVFVSYHGPNTDGADSVEVDGARLVRCSSETIASGCIERVHGAIEATDDGLLAALGTPPRIGRFAAGGVMEQTWESGFKRAHLVEFARRQESMFSIESCAKSGGMAVIDMRTNSSRVVQPEAAVIPPRGLAARTVCGERIAVGKPPLIAVMKRGTITGVGGVLLLETSGRLIRWSPLRPAPVDVLVLPAIR